MAAAAACSSPALAGCSLLQLQNEFVRKVGRGNGSRVTMRSRRTVRRQSQVERPKRMRTGSLSSETPSYLSTSGEFGDDGYVGEGESGELSFDPESFARNRALEVAQGRVAMLASVGFVVPEVIVRSGVDLDVSEGRIAGAFLACQVVVMAALEGLRGKESSDGVSAVFDPLGLGSKPDGFVDLTVKEIKNGRLALVSLLGFAAQGVVTGKGPVQNLIDHFTDPFANNLLTYASSDALGFAAFQGVFTRTSFAALFLTTLIHWGRPLYMNNATMKTVGKLTMSTAYACLTGILLSIWASSGHLPLSNLYESSMFLSWCFCTMHVILENQNKNDWIGIITAPSALLTNAFATLGIPKEMQQSTALVPALQSNWLMMHVSMMIFSYSTLMIGSLLAIAFLFVDTKEAGLETQRGKLGQQLDHYSYRSITLGFPLLTIGILSGAVWANEAWGSYWSWDPKETWALITWLVFAIYVHTRMSKGWQGKKPAMVASGGFFVIWICYLGVNLLGKGLHSYGWFS
ncbi:hypothetical protein KC19_9G112300 [Ceratodon purpureus]|uniref:Cytochrome c assembly protein domain-containing protein n=1 Tax=Ceratodon purpureus TaxID=3225 RepID=A0A8T0GQY0_CERPU|nr:hypothetical protein KC19_9G112300 [Ceratodon purpureus]